MNRVFVYGSLMKGYWNYSRFLDGRVKSSTVGSLKGDLYHLPQGYPALLVGENTVKGEVIEIDDETLRALDFLEGYYGEGKNNLYYRAEVCVQAQGENMLCWTYFYNDEEYAQSHGIKILNGDWKEFMERGGTIND